MEINARIQKSEIADTVAFHGCANAVPIFNKPEGAVVLVSFAGSRDASTGDYVGRYVFRAAKPADEGAKRVDFLAELPGVATPRRGKKK